MHAAEIVPSHIERYSGFQITQFLAVPVAEGRNPIPNLAWTARTQLRFGYWIIGKKPRMRNKWTWSQFAPLIPKVDLLKLIRKARKKGIL